MLKDILSVGFLVSLVSGTIRFSAPLLLASLGQILPQRAGILNLSVEGTMLIASISGFIGAFFSGSLMIGLLCGMLAGALWSLIMAFLSVNLRTNQVIAGLGLNILASGCAAYLYRVVFGIRQLPPQVIPFQSVRIPFLSRIQVIGPMFFEHNGLVYLSFLLVPVTWFLLEKTVYGLRLKAVGEHPRAADSKGISVSRTRISAMVIGGLYTGAAGAFMSIGYLNLFTETLIGGRGYIAVAIVIFSAFKPQKAMVGALLF